MVKRIDLKWPVLVLIGFFCLFGPFLSHLIPQHGWKQFFISPQIYFLVASALVLWHTRCPLSEFLSSRAQIKKHVLWGLWLGLAPIALVLTLAGLAHAIHQYTAFLPHPLFGGPPLPFDVSLRNGLLLLLLAPISEELFFRGILLGSLKQSYPNWLAIGVSAIVFASGHGFPAIGPFFLGLVSGWVTVRTHSIVSGIVFHAISNTYVPLIFLCFPNFYSYLHFLFH